MSFGAGSWWCRWDPHLHAPGTLLNDGFNGDWAGYFDAINRARPAPVALGITDYFTMRAYKQFLTRRTAVPLPSVQLVFANIELRLTIETKRRKGINLHLLLSPDESDHVSLMETHLARLEFEYKGNLYSCNDTDLMRLGRAHSAGAPITDEVALSKGANQFKVELSAVRDLFKDRWVRENVLVGVASGEDGLSGLADDSGFNAHRQELGRFADIIFSGNPNDRIYWSGADGKLKADGLEPRPCLHGSDAHKVSDVLVSSLSPSDGSPRHCWIKGAATFEGLRQTLAEPMRRVCIGPSPPQGPPISETVSSLRLLNADWIETPTIDFNNGLVSIIGARGSGKTALIELLAISANAEEPEPGPASFIAKAGDLLIGATMDLEWADNSKLSRTVGDPKDGHARVRYLSQQFVEALCSGDTIGNGEPLQREIESVVFEAIPEEDRMLCLSFDELRDLRIETVMSQRLFEAEGVADLTKQIAEQNQLASSVKSIEAGRVEARRLINSLEAELKALPTQANEAVQKSYTELADGLGKLREAIARAKKHEQAVVDVTAEVKNLIASSDGAWNTLQMRYPGVLDDKTWEMLRLRPDPNAAQTMQELLSEAKATTDALRQRGLRGESLDEGLLQLEARFKEAVSKLGLDQANLKKRADIERRLYAAKKSDDAAAELATKAASAQAKARELFAKRLEGYGRSFNLLNEHVAVLRELYAPLEEQLASDERLRKLRLYVTRVVDIDSWARVGERLFDLRGGPFAGVGELQRAAETALRSAWESGTADDVKEAMSAFATTVGKQKRAQDVTPAQVGAWLFSTDHISVRYGLEYDGVSLSRLSPGTKGVVLLTLYLALDQWDQRPILIDQPEENLDPRSIYDDLVPFFREASTRRQVIIVTHNANLVVNGDSDQIIIADAERINPGELPVFRYRGGGLDDREIRHEVCALLEGGFEAFEKRRKRYGHRA